MLTIDQDPSRSLVMLNEQGDTTITWEPDEDDAMLAIIEKKMAAGVTFYTVPQRKPGQRGRLAAPKALKEASDATKHRALSIKDDDFSKFVLDGRGKAVPSASLVTQEEPAPVAGGKAPKGLVAQRAKTARQVASGHSIGVQPRRGG